MARIQRVAFIGALLLLAATLTGSLSATAVASTPITSDNRPSPLAGKVNGEVPESDLVKITPTCRAVRAAATSLYRLFSLARAEGIRLDADECYRPLDLQVVAQRSATANGNSACAASVSRTPTGKPVGNSMHGWGKAADMEDNAGSLRFSSKGYAFLKRRASAVGWNHPGWAEPGGSACPEPWHWEWVGDGGRLGRDPIRADVVGLVGGPSDKGYGLVTGLGDIEVRGSLANAGSMAAVPINWLVVGSASTPARNGYLMAAADGGVFAFGDATFHGSMGGRPLNEAVVGVTATPTGRGYWLVAADGGIFSFGDAKFFGSMGAERLARPVMAMAPTPTGKGYWLVGADGGIFGFGDMKFFGTLGGTPINQPIVGIAGTASGNGYWLVAADGGIFAFGDAKFFGSAAGQPVRSPVIGMTPTTTGNGYWIVTAGGDVFAYGDATL